MIRGTTATFKFKMPHKLKYISSARVTFWQDGYYGAPGSSLPINKYYPKDIPADPESTELIVVLQGSETKAFTDKLKARVQMKAANGEYIDENGNTITKSTFGSHVELFTVYPMDDSIMDWVGDEETSLANGEYIILSGGNIIEVGDS